MSEGGKMRCPICGLEMDSNGLIAWCENAHVYSLESKSIPGGRAMTTTTRTARLEFSIPGLRVQSEANLRDSWPARFRRKKAQQLEVHAEWKRHAKGIKITLPCVVRLTRIGAQRLDDDNLAGAFKSCRDQIAREIGVDDGDERIRFEYAQVAVGKRQYAVKVEIHYGENSAGEAGR